MAYPAPVYPYCGPVAHSSGTGNLPITRIVIHCTAGSDGKGSTGTCAYFRDPDSGGSAHYITDANQTIQPARLNVVCWHAPPNLHSIGVEMCCSLANQGQGHWTLDSHVKMMERTAKLTAELCLYLGVPVVRLTVAQVRAGARGICGHVDVSKAFGQSSHWDPGPYFPWDTFMGMVRAWVKKLTTPVTPPTPPTPKPPPETLLEDDMFITRYGSSLYRMFIDRRVIGLSEGTYNALRDGGVPVRQLSNAAVDALTSICANSLLVDETPTAGTEDAYLADILARLDAVEAALAPKPPAP